MPAFIGSTKVKDFYIGSVKLKELYCGSIKIWSGKLPVGTVVFESSTAGTYSIDIDRDQDFRIIAVGGGSGGTYNLDNSGDHMEKQGSASGGSGAYLEFVKTLQKGSYTVTVGAGGAKNGGFHDGSSFPSGAGGDTYMSLNGTDLFKCGGGTSATALYATTFRGSAGQGGSNTLPSEYITIEENTVGNNGSSKVAYSNLSGGASVYNGYGAGGSSQSDYRWGNSTAGTAGYLKIIAA